MSSVEVSHESQNLHIGSLLSQQGPIAVYQAQTGQQHHLFYFYAVPSEPTQVWLSEVLHQRSQIEHPYLPVLTFHGVLDDGGIGWSVPLNAGMSLREIWDTDPHNPLRSIRLVMQAVDAVAQLHAVGGVHGDIRAQNFWISWDDQEGEMLNLHGEQLGLWNFNGHQGTERWDSTELSLDVAECLSPEVAAGDVPNMKSDVYGLGVMLFRALHGHVPYPVENAWEMAALQATSELERPVMNPPIHNELWTIIEACLQKNPQHRPSVLELRQSIEPFVQYKLPIFLDLELTDPQSIAEPTPPVKEPEPIDLRSSQSSTKTIQPRSFESLSFVEARPTIESKEKDDKDSERQEKLDPSAESESMVKSPSGTHPQDTNQDIEEDTQEFTLKVERPQKVQTVDPVQHTDPDVTMKMQTPPSDQALANPIQILVGARPMPATTGPLRREDTDATNNLSQLAWLEDSSERIIEAPVQYEVTAGHNALSKVSTTASQERTTGEHSATHVDARKSRTRSRTKTNTGFVSKVKRSATQIPEQMQFVIFMTLSSVITVLLLKIAEKVL